MREIVSFTGTTGMGQAPPLPAMMAYMYSVALLGIARGLDSGSTPGGATIGSSQPSALMRERRRKKTVKKGKGAMARAAIVNDASMSSSIRKLG